jgi:hypothetical protein
MKATKAARILGLILIVLVGAWDIDAMRPHIAAHSWYTLSFVLLFLAVHLGNYLTVGRLIYRFDPLQFAEGLSPMPRQTTAKLYTFTMEQAETAQAVGGPAVARPHYSIVPLD